MPDLSHFHFLRPLWLLALLPTLALYLVITRSESADRQWQGIIASHLLRHLKVGAEGRARVRPIHLIVGVLVLGTIALAGPAWQRELPPFASDTAPLVIALDVSTTMNAVDVQPTRLERSKQKIRDLLTRRSAAPTALIAYAGSAHSVVPLSDDPGVFETFLTALTPDIMPSDGHDAAAALSLAEAILTPETTPGTVLFVTDGISTRDVPAFADFGQRTDDAVLVLAVGTVEGGPIQTGDGRFQTDVTGRRIISRLDREGLETLAREAGTIVTSTTVDDADVERIQRRVQSHLEQVQQTDESTRWRDTGYYLLYPIVLLALLWFRKGWTVRWGAVVLMIALSGCAGENTRFADLWLTPDQQGRRLFERGEYAAAAERFQDPMWAGIAFHRDGDLEQAVDAFARVETPEAYYNAGNAYAGLKRYEEAVASYEVALEMRPDWAEARENRNLVQALMAAQSDADDSSEPQGPPTFDADEITFDEKGSKGERGEVPMEQLTADQMNEMWMRRLQTSPADFLRVRFAMEATAGEEGETR